MRVVRVVPVVSHDKDFVVPDSVRGHGVVQGVFDIVLIHDLAVSKQVAIMDLDQVSGHADNSFDENLRAWDSIGLRERERVAQERK